MNEDPEKMFLTDSRPVLQSLSGDLLQQAPDGQPAASGDGNVRIVVWPKKCIVRRARCTVLAKKRLETWCRC